MKNLFFIFIGLLSFTASAHFSTLAELHEYAKTHPADITSLHNDIQYPDFSHIYDQYKPGFFGRLLRSMGVSLNNRWNPEQFKKLLEHGMYQQEHHKPATHTITVPANGYCYVWGDLYGDMHSLIGGLAYCAEELKILNDNLKIVRDNTYLFFLGNTMGLTPYSLETLTIILTLIQKNAGKVFYLSGEMEKNGAWENTTMAQQLRVYAASFKTEHDFGIPLQESINTYFETLPHSVTLQTTARQHPHEIILSHSVKTAQPHASINSVIVSGESFLPLQQLAGLQFLGYMQGAATWSLISCPTPLYQMYYGFKKDSFACITMGTALENTTITAYSRDTQSQQPFTKETFTLSTGMPATNGMSSTPTVYTVGSLIPLEGNQALTGNTIHYGISAGLHNQKNGASFLIHDIILDDQSSAPLAYENLKKLHDFGVTTLLMPVGSIAFQAYIKTVRDQTLYLLFPYTGSSQLRNAELKNVINLIPSYQEELETLIPHMMDTYQSKKFALIYQEDASGKDALKAAHDILQSKGITDYVSIPYSPAQTDFTSEITQLRASNPDTIGFFATTSAVQEFLDQLGSEDLVNKNMFGLSCLNSLDLKNFLKTIGAQIVSTDGGLPAPSDKTVAIVAQYQEAMDTLSLPYEAKSLNGFIAAQLLLDALTHVKPPYMPQAIMNYFEGFKNYNFKGLTLTFEAPKRSLGLIPKIVKLS